MLWKAVMFMIGYLIKGLVLGFSIAAPVGPIGVLCIRRTLAGGMTSGLVCGLGTAAADALYGLVAALGFTALTAALVEQQHYLRLAGGLFLCYLGVAAFGAAPGAANTPGDHYGSAGGFVSAFFLTLTNPMTILSFTAVFAGVGLAEASSGYWPAVLMVFGVFCGSLLWWLVLSFVVARLRASINQQWLKWINRLSGLVVMSFGVACLSALL